MTEKAFQKIKAGLEDARDMLAATPADAAQSTCKQSLQVGNNSRSGPELSGISGELIDKVAEAIRGNTTSDDTPWETLSEERKIGWRGDAERALAAVKDYLTTAAPAAPAQEQVAYISPISLNRRAKSAWHNETCILYRDGGVDRVALYAAPPAPVAASAVAMPAEISRELLGQIVDEVFDGAIEDASVIEDIYRVIARKLSAIPLSPNPVADIPAAETIVNAPRVKALEWRISDVWADAESAIGNYGLRQLCDGLWRVYLNGGEICEDDGYPTLDTARAAAQADYERRVRACLEPGQGWRSMDSAPRDGTEILVYFPLDGLNTNWARRVPVIWGGKEWVHTGRSGGYSRAYQPTHWQPLPPPPAAEGK